MSRMNSVELRASTSLASIFGLRMLGMFVILPVFAIYAEELKGGGNLTLVGIALGVYGLTQALLQVPFGWMSDRYGRKPVIYFGLAVFALGSFIAAMADSIYWVIFGRIVQGAGAISAAVMAMAADLTREEHRTKAMAMIGATIGLTFALSLVASPWLNQLIGVPGIFAMTGVLALAAMGVVYALVPDVPGGIPPRGGTPMPLTAILMDRELARLNFGIFVLHAVLMALFIVVPLALREAGLAVGEHWKVYLPVMLGSFVLMLPAIFAGERRGRARAAFLGAVALLLLGQLAMPWSMSSIARITVFLLVFFTAFNVLEASLPSLVSRFAPPQAKGAAIGLYSSVQFFGTFVGAASGGYLYQRFGAQGIFVFDAVLLAAWLAFAWNMPPRERAATRVFTLPALDDVRTDTLIERLRAQPGVRGVQLAAGGRAAYLEIDTRGFDEHHVLRLIAGEV